MSISNIGKLCAICEEHHTNERLFSLKCCSNQFCGTCLRQYQACGACNVPLTTEVAFSLFKNFCVVCKKSTVSSSSSEGNAELVNNNNEHNLTTVLETVKIGCGHDHQAHKSCLISHIAKCVNADLPITCPQHQACKCLVKNVAMLLKDNQILLRRYYDNQVAQAQREHRLQRACPQCGMLLVIGTATNCKNTIANCTKCRQFWCCNCWLPEHPGLDCATAARIRSEWMFFIRKQVNITKNVHAELLDQLRIFDALCADEQRKAANMRHCPYCGLACEKEKGTCDAVVCGFDAEDRGGKRHANCGCKKSFNWANAKKYQPKVTRFTPQLDARLALTNKDGVLNSTISPRNSSSSANEQTEICNEKVQVPARLCRLCLQIIVKGTVFEEISRFTQHLNVDPRPLLREFEAARHIQYKCKPEDFENSAFNALTLRNLLQKIPSPNTQVLTLFNPSDEGLSPSSSFVVWGAKDRGLKCNGMYHAVVGRTHNGRPLYANSDGAHIYYKRYWKMTRTDDLGGWLFSVHKTYGMEPPTGQWTTHGAPSTQHLPFLRKVPNFSSPKKKLATKNFAVGTKPHKNSVSIVLKTDVFPHGQKLFKIRVQTNKPRFKELSPVKCHISCIFQLSSGLHTAPNIQYNEIIAKLGLKSPCFQLDLSPMNMPLKRGWCVLVSRNAISAEIAIHTRNKLSFSEQQTLLDVLHRVHIRLQLVSHTINTPKDTARCCLEKMEIYSCPKLPDSVRQWLWGLDQPDTIASLNHHLLNSQRQSPSSKKNMGFSSLNDLFQIRLGLCWPCLKAHLGGVDMRTVQIQADSDANIKIGSLVRLAAVATKKSLKKLDKTSMVEGGQPNNNGPLRFNGPPAIVVDLCKTDQIHVQTEKVCVRALETGQLFWYDKTAVYHLKDADFDDLGDLQGSPHGIENSTILTRLYKIPFDVSEKHMCRILQPVKQSHLQTLLASMWTSLSPNRPISVPGSVNQLLHSIGLLRRLADRYGQDYAVHIFMLRALDEKMTLLDNAQQHQDLSCIIHNAIRNTCFQILKCLNQWLNSPVPPVFQISTEMRDEIESLLSDVRARKLSFERSVILAQKATYKVAKLNSPEKILKEMYPKALVSVTSLGIPAGAAVFLLKKHHGDWALALDDYFENQGAAKEAAATLKRRIKLTKTKAVKLHAKVETERKLKSSAIATAKGRCLELYKQFRDALHKNHSASVAKDIEARVLRVRPCTILLSKIRSLEDIQTHEETQQKCQIIQDILRATQPLLDFIHMLAEQSITQHFERLNLNVRSTDQPKLPIISRSVLKKLSAFALGISGLYCAIVGEDNVLNNVPEGCQRTIHIRCLQSRIYATTFRVYINSGNFTLQYRLCNVKPDFRNTFPIYLQNRIDTVKDECSQLSTAEQLWLELELSGHPAYAPAWDNCDWHAHSKMHTSEVTCDAVGNQSDIKNLNIISNKSGTQNNGSAGRRANGREARCQNLPRGAFVGRLSAVILRANPAALTNLWLLVYDASCGNSREYTTVPLVAAYPVGRHVIRLGIDIALIFLTDPVLISASHAIVFTCVTDDGLESPRIMSGSSTESEKSTSHSQIETINPSTQSSAAKVSFKTQCLHQGKGQKGQSTSVISKGSSSLSPSSALTSNPQRSKSGSMSLTFRVQHADRWKGADAAFKSNVAVRETTTAQSPLHVRLFGFSANSPFGKTAMSESNDTSLSLLSSSTASKPVISCFESIENVKKFRQAVSLTASLCIGSLLIYFPEENVKTNQSHNGLTFETAISLLQQDWGALCVGRPLRCKDLKQSCSPTISNTSVNLASPFKYSREATKRLHMDSCVKVASKTSISELPSTILRRSCSSCSNLLFTANPHEHQCTVCTCKQQTSMGTVEKASTSSSDKNPGPQMINDVNKVFTNVLAKAEAALKPPSIVNLKSQMPQSGVNYVTGDHVILRHDETRGFSTPAVVLSGKVGEAIGERKLVAFLSGSPQLISRSATANVQPFYKQQCDVNDLCFENLHAHHFSSCAIAILSYLKEKLAQMQRCSPNSKKHIINEDSSSISSSTSKIDFLENIIHPHLTDYSDVNKTALARYELVNDEEACIFVLNKVQAIAEKMKMPKSLSDTDTKRFMVFGSNLSMTKLVPQSSMKMLLKKIVELDVTKSLENPVTKLSFNISDQAKEYFTIISHPMCWKTVRKNLNLGLYNGKNVLTFYTKSKHGDTFKLLEPISLMYEIAKDTVKSWWDTLKMHTACLRTNKNVFRKNCPSLHDLLKYINIATPFIWSTTLDAKKSEIWMWLEANVLKYYEEARHPSLKKLQNRMGIASDALNNLYRVASFARSVLGINHDDVVTVYANLKSALKRVVAVECKGFCFTRSQQQLIAQSAIDLQRLSAASAVQELQKAMASFFSSCDGGLETARTAVGLAVAYAAEMSQKRVKLRAGDVVMCISDVAIAESIVRPIFGWNQSMSNAVGKRGMVIGEPTEHRVRVHCEGRTFSWHPTCWSKVVTIADKKAVTTAAEAASILIPKSLPKSKVSRLALAIKQCASHSHWLVKGETTDIAPATLIWIVKSQMRRTTAGNRKKSVKTVKDILNLEEKDAFLQCEDTSESRIIKKITKSKKEKPSSNSSSGSKIINPKQYDWLVFCPNHHILAPSIPHAANGETLGCSRCTSKLAENGFFTCRRCNFRLCLCCVSKKKKLYSKNGRSRLKASKFKLSKDCVTNDRSLFPTFQRDKCDPSVRLTRPILRRTDSISDLHTTSDHSATAPTSTTATDVHVRKFHQQVTKTTKQEKNDRKRISMIANTADPKIEHSPPRRRRRTQTRESSAERNSRIRLSTRGHKTVNKLGQRRSGRKRKAPKKYTP